MHFQQSNFSFSDKLNLLVLVGNVPLLQLWSDLFIKLSLGDFQHSKFEQFHQNEFGQMN